MDAIGDLPPISAISGNEVQPIWDLVADYEPLIMEAEKAFKIRASQQCGKILVCPTGLQMTQEGGR